MIGKANANLLGRLTRDPELKTVGGVSLVTFGVAVNRKTKNGEEAHFFDVEAWREKADIIAKYLKKGDPVDLECQMKVDSFEDKDGNKRTKIKFEVGGYKGITFLSSPADAPKDGIAEGEAKPPAPF